MTSVLTNEGGVVKTLIDTITVPMDVHRLVGISGYCCSGAGITTLENVSGILTLESDEGNISPLIMPLDIVLVLTNGVATLKPTIWPVNITMIPGQRIRGYVTLDLATAIVHTCRFTLIFE